MFHIYNFEKMIIEIFKLHTFLSFLMPLSIILGNLSTILTQTVRIYHFEKLLSTFLQSLSVIITYHLRDTSVPTYNFGKNVKLDSYYPCLSSIWGSGHLM